MTANNTDQQYTVRGGYRMSEQEERQQLGECAYEVNSLKGELNKITEKLNRTLQAYTRMAESKSADNWKADGGQLLISGAGHSGEVSYLLSKDELIPVLESRQAIMTELESATQRLKRLAPHIS